MQYEPTYQDALAWAASPEQYTFCVDILEVSAHDVATDGYVDDLESRYVSLWLDAAAERGFRFAASLRESLREYKSLTDKQFEAAIKCMAEDYIREQTRANKPAKARLDTGLDISSLVELGKKNIGYFAVPDGETRLKLCVRRVEREGDKWHGWIFVDDGAVYGSRAKYGNQRPGGTYRGKCEDALRRIVADPVGALQEYGRLTSTCGICGLPLEDETSVEIGIGPVCRGRLEDAGKL
jgi:hypothetical protein